jgi:hypothetical protein
MVGLTEDTLLRINASLGQPRTSAMRSTIDWTGPLSHEKPETAIITKEDRTMNTIPSNGDQATMTEEVDSVLEEWDTEMRNIESGLFRENESRQSSRQPASSSTAPELNTVATTPEAHNISEVSNGEPMEGIISSQTQLNVPPLIHNIPALEPDVDGDVYQSERAGSHVGDAMIPSDERITSSSGVYDQMASVPDAAIPAHQPATQFPRRNQKFHESRAHLDAVQWTPPNPGQLPEHDDAFLYGIEMVKKALADTTKACDKQQYPEYFNKFLPDGVYTPQHMESVAVSVVQQAYRLCTHGATNLFFLTQQNHPTGRDVDLDFGARLQWIALIVERFKSAANDVMCDTNTEKFLVAPNAAFAAMEKHLKQWKRQQQRVMAQRDADSTMKDVPRFEHSENPGAAPAQGSDWVNGEFGIVHGHLVSPKKPPSASYGLVPPQLQGSFLMQDFRKLSEHQRTVLQEKNCQIGLVTRVSDYSPSQQAVRQALSISNRLQAQLSSSIVQSPRSMDYPLGYQQGLNELQRINHQQSTFIDRQLQQDRNERNSKSATKAFLPEPERSIEELCNAPSNSLTRTEWIRLYTPIFQGFDPLTGRKLAPSKVDWMCHYQEQFAESTYSTRQLIDQPPVPQHAPPSQSLQPASDMINSQGQHQLALSQAPPVARHTGVKREVARSTDHQRMGPPHVLQPQPTASQQP